MPQTVARALRSLLPDQCRADSAFDITATRLQQADFFAEAHANGLAADKRDAVGTTRRYTQTRGQDPDEIAAIVDPRNGGEWRLGFPGGKGGRRRAAPGLQDPRF